MAQTLYQTFFQWNGILKQAKVFIGLANYKAILFDDRFFYIALKNTVLWTACALTIPMTIGLLFAISLNKDMKGKVFFRAVFYIPQLFSAVVVAMVWAFIYHPQLGLINQTLRALGLSSWTRGWLGDAHTALPAVFITAVWISSGYMMMIFLSGLQSIPKEIYESAAIDGVNPVQKLFRITIPLLRETFISFSLSP
jgi:raffinose/stachyose/melibiose transport system permease protein